MDLYSALSYREHVPLRHSGICYQARIQLYADQAAASPLGLGFYAFTVRKCTKFGLLTLRRITKIVVIICQILRLKCTKFDFEWAPPRLCYGSLQPSPDTLTRFKGPTSKGGRGEKRREKEGLERGEGKSASTIPNSWIRHCSFCIKN